ncbi:MAG: hypothetical protein IJY87_05640 [Bacilli bacterium]|nr:hypothetical protein [Bacilli bacterium]
MTLDRMTFEVYWSYYKSIENMFIDTIQYVSPSKTNEKTYSDEYAKIILLCGSEIDSILKLICKLEKINPEKRDYSMNDYSKFISKSTILKEECYSPECMTTTKEKFIMESPFKNIKVGVPYSGLDWWKNYQALKHNRMKNAKKGNLQNTVSLLVAHYILIRYLINYLGKNYGIDYVKENNVSRILIPCL